MRIRHNTVALDSADRIRHRATVRRRRREAARMAEAIEARAKQRRWTRAEVVGLFLDWDLPRGFALKVTICPHADRILASLSGPLGDTPIAVIHVCDSCLTKDNWPSVVAEAKADLEAEAGISRQEFLARAYRTSAN